MAVAVAVTVTAPRCKREGGAAVEDHPQVRSAAVEAKVGEQNTC